MKRIFVVAVLTIMGSSLAMAQTSESQTVHGKIERALVKLDKEWAAAEARGDTASINRILADEYVFTDLDGKVGDKRQFLVHTKSSDTRPESITPDDYKVRFYGNTAVMTHSATLKGRDNSEQARAIHVWVNRRGRWQVVAHQWTLTTQEPGKPVPKEFLMRCARYSFEPEVRSFYGNSVAVLEKIENDNMGLADRRGYLLLIETNESAEIAFFDRLSEERFNVLQWYGGSAGNLREQLTDTILANRGVACVGAQTKAIVQAKFNPTSLGAIPTPLSASAAFRHFIKKYGDTNYLRVTAFLLC